MRRDYYQVVGRGPWNIDHPNGNAVAYRPGNIFEESPLNRSVARGIRTARLRKLSDREATALRALAASQRQGPVTPTPTPTPPKKTKPPTAPKTSSGASSGSGTSE